MQDHSHLLEECAARRALEPQKRERGVQLVVLLTAGMMAAEIVVGYATGSMALLADGWHMATHVGALGLASAAYWVSRRYAQHRAFAFGTGKVRALAGYTSAVTLGLVALAMVVESVERLVAPHTVDFVSSLPVAVLGLVVNLASVFLLHDGEREPGADDHGDHHDHGHHHDHDHNHRAAFLHVVADTFTSVLAIVALLVGKRWGWTWLDALCGAVGGVVILVWAFSLSRTAAFELLDVSPSSKQEDEIRAVLEALDDVRVTDLHVWSLGGAAKSCIVTLVTTKPRDARSYRAALARFRLSHLTVEVQRSDGASERADYV